MKVPKVDERFIKISNLQEHNFGGITNIVIYFVQAQNKIIFILKIVQFQVIISHHFNSTLIQFISF